MGCVGSKEGTVTPMGSGKIDYAALKPDEYTAKVHSAIRWGKPIADIEPFFAAKAEGINCEDSKNGNRPIHIAAQNGHLDLVKYLCGKGCDCNAQNGSGNTALHMAMAYDYFWCARILRANGALEDKLNNDNFTSGTGIEDDKKKGDWLPAMISAHNTEELNEAMEGLKAQDRSTIDKASFIQAAMAKKKSAKDIWSEDHQATFKAICGEL